MDYGTKHAGTRVIIFQLVASGSCEKVCRSLPDSRHTIGINMSRSSRPRLLDASPPDRPFDVRRSTGVTWVPVAAELHEAAIQTMPPSLRPGEGPASASRRRRLQQTQEVQGILLLPEQSRRAGRVISRGPPRPTQLLGQVARLLAQRYRPHGRLRAAKPKAISPSPLRNVVATSGTGVSVPVISTRSADGLPPV